ncbi:MAG: hypothetical protein DRJ41_04960 [Thermoprotei archaeon]|nr:MAG: hypothetical protein DRJ41_04960 [Thermoprotei archaeon]
MKRAGISRVAVEVIILVIGVALALLIFSPIGSYIFGALGRTSTVGGQTTISVLSVSGLGTGSATLYVKNLGPNDISNVADTTDWQLFIDNQNVPISGVSGDATDDLLEVDEVAQLTFDGSGFSNTTTHTILLYGPGGTMTEWFYRP